MSVPPRQGAPALNTRCVRQRRRGLIISLQDLGNIGEFVGAIAVVVSLAYLAIQIRQNTRAVRASSFHGVTDSFNLLNVTIARDEALARIIRVGGENLSNLTEDERVRFGFLLLGVFRVFETLYYEKKQGTGDPGLWTAEIGTMVALLGDPGAREWWTSNPLSFTPEFRRFVEDEILARVQAEGAAQQGTPAAERSDGARSRLPSR